MTNGYIYLIRAGNTDLYKIGLTTRQPEERLRELNGSQSPYHLSLSHFVWVNDVHKTERYIHKSLDKYHHHNEWFQFPGNSVQIAIALMGEVSGQRQVKPVDKDEADDLILFWALLPGFLIVTILLLIKGLPDTSPKHRVCVIHNGGAACERLKEE